MRDDELAQIQNAVGQLAGSGARRRQAAAQALNGRYEGQIRRSQTCPIGLSTARDAVIIEIPLRQSQSVFAKCVAEIIGSLPCLKKEAQTTSVELLIEQP
jgi:hypothetical protein